MKDIYLKIKSNYTKHLTLEEALVYTAVHEAVTFSGFHTNDPFVRYSSMLSNLKEDLPFFDTEATVDALVKKDFLSRWKEDGDLFITIGVNCLLLENNNYLF